MKARTRVAVIGAGIGGLTTALSLRAFDIDVVILEQASRLDPVGAGIQLSPNANQVLARLGVLDPIVDSAFEPRTLEVLTGRSGRKLLSAPVGAWARARYARPYLNVHRGDLHAVLLNAVREAMPNGLRLDSRVTSVEQGDDGVTLRLHRGGTVDADLVVGADGVHSAVRPHVVPTDQPARFTGHVAYRMLVPRSALPAGRVPPPAVTLWMAPHGHIVSYWVRRGELYNVVAIVEDSTWREDGWNIKADLAAVRVAFSDWSPRLHALFDAAGDIHKWALLDHRVPPRWSRERVALLGDSCHAMLPYLAQGGAMAIEDAWVLASVLAQIADPVAALARYSQIRVDRATRVHAGAIRNANAFHRSGLQAVLRDTGLRALSTHPERFLDRMDWIYGHDVTAITA
jgi:salicylate hydroxylase